MNIKPKISFISRSDDEYQQIQMTSKNNSYQNLLTNLDEKTKYSTKFIIYLWICFFTNITFASYWFYELFHSLIFYNYPRHKHLHSTSLHVNNLITGLIVFKILNNFIGLRIWMKKSIKCLQLNFFLIVPSLICSNIIWLFSWENGKNCLFVKFIFVVEMFYILIYNIMLIDMLKMCRRNSKLTIEKW